MRGFMDMLNSILILPKPQIETWESYEPEANINFKTKCAKTLGILIKLACIGYILDNVWLQVLIDQTASQNSLKMEPMFWLWKRIRSWTEEHKNEIKSVTDRHQTPQKGYRRSPKAHQKGTKLMPKRAKNTQMMLRGKRFDFLMIFWQFWVTTSAPFSSQDPQKCLKQYVRKSMLKRYQLFIPKSCKNHAQTMVKSNENSDTFRNLRFLWFCKEYNVFLWISHIRRVRNHQQIHIKFTT